MMGLEWKRREKIMMRAYRAFFFYQREKGGLENCDVMERKKRKNE